MLTTEIDAYGRVQLDENDLKRMLYAGLDTSGVFVKDTEAIRQYNELCKQWDKPDAAYQVLPPITHSPEEEHARRQSEWFYPPEMTNLDVREFMEFLAETPDERARVSAEMDIFDKNQLMPVLHLMLYLVEHFRFHDVVWGVGRGSSVASHVLYRIGVHKIDALKYKLDIKEFIKD